MTVKELIKELEKFDPEYKINFGASVHDSEWGIEVVDLITPSFTQYRDEQYVSIHFIEDFGD